MNEISFDIALQKTVEYLSLTVNEYRDELIILRDQLGRIRLIFTGVSDQYDAVVSKMDDLWSVLGAYASLGKRVLAADDFIKPELIFNSPDLIRFQPEGSGENYLLLDRQVSGQGWYRDIKRKDPEIKRVVFYGLKGGVGRSTAMAVYAHHLSQMGKKVLLVDLDLESPGLSSIMLPDERIPEFGIVDWLIEEAVSPGKVSIDQITGISPISDIGNAEVVVASALGQNEADYLSKLARIYGDVPGKGGVIHFYDRINALLTALETSVKPDAVLIDSRAGLHDIAAVSITGLADRVLMFGGNTSQSWRGYRLLFSHFQQRPDLLKTIRDRFFMVYSLFPKSEQEVRKKDYIANSYELFSETLYEEEQAGVEDCFNFDLYDESSPHYPALILHDERFQEFSIGSVQQNLLTKNQIDAAFGDLFSKMELFWS